MLYFDAVEERTADQSEFLLLGNLLCLDLVNTEAVDDGRPVDLLSGFADLLAWLVRAGGTNEASLRTAPKRGTGRSEGAAAFRQAVALRGSLRQMADRLVKGKPPSDSQLELINQVLAEGSSYRRLMRTGKGFSSAMVPERDSAVQLLVPVAESAAWLLEHGDLRLLRRCENPRCVLYFYDTTRNGRRRWCSMAGCGSRAKAAAYYRRKRGAS